MTFKMDQVEKFKTMIQKNAYLIKAFEGCIYLKILQDQKEPNIFFTYSYWSNEQCLENYRNSDLFKIIWSAAKEGFSESAEAWTVDNVIELTE